MARPRAVLAAALLAAAAAALETPTANISMFKRTHASCRAFDDGEFVAWKLGMVVSVNVTYYCNAGTQFMTLKPCAERVAGTSTSITPCRGSTSASGAVVLLGGKARSMDGRLSSKTPPPPSAKKAT